MDWSLFITVGLIFLATMTGAYLRYHSKDPCLNSFDGYHVTLERTSGKVVWGHLSLAATGMELVYKNKVQDEDHIESSYILYSSEFFDIQGIYRFADEMTPELRDRRAQDIERSFHPRPARRLTRSARNVLSTASASLSEVFGLLVGRMKKPAARYLDDKGEVYLNKLGTTILGQANAPYDPLLERHIGQKVVVELVEGNEVHEHVGIFKNYSSDFFELLNVRFPYRESLTLNPDGSLCCRPIESSYSGGCLTVRNTGEQPVLLQRLHKNGEELLLNVVIDGGETVDLHPEPRYLGGALQVQVVRELDMLLPRTRCILRHHAEHYRPESLPAALFDMVFDVGIALSKDRRLELREQRLREQLERDPLDALAAANLGALLLQQQEHEEAERWLNTALSMAEQLPDHGRRAQMQLRELGRRTGAGGVVRQTDSLAPQPAVGESSMVLTVQTAAAVTVDGVAAAAKATVTATAAGRQELPPM